MEMDVPTEALRFRAPVAIGDGGRVIDIHHGAQIAQGARKTMDDELSHHDSLSELEDDSLPTKHQMGDGNLRLSERRAGWGGST